MTDVSSVKEEEKDNVQLDATSGGSRKGSLTHVCGCSKSHNTDKNIFITYKQLKRLLYPLICWSCVHCRVLKFQINHIG